MIELDVFTNQIIYKINNCLEKFRHNVIIASFHEIYSYFRKLLSKDINYSNLKNNYEKILLSMFPTLPHLASECLESINYEGKIEWPDIDTKYLNEDNINIVIQINGKKRNLINTKKNIEEKNLVREIENLNLIDKYIVDVRILKIIYIKNKVINFITKK